MNTLLAQTEAMRLADQGFIPIPLHSGSKVPLAERDWQLQPMPSHAEIKSTWTDDARHNIGVLTGNRSNNLQALDFDIYKAHSQWQSAYNAPKTKLVFTYRGVSPIYRIVGGDTLNGKMRGDAGDLLGNGHQRVWSPSEVMTTDKTLYTYWDTSDPIADIPADHPAILALIKQIEQKAAEKAPGRAVARRTDKKVARLAKAYVEGRINTFGKHYGSKSELDAAVILSLYQSGHDEAEIYAFMAESQQDSHWHAYKRESDKIAEIQRVIRKAGNLNSRQWDETMRRADALRDFRTSHVWKGRYEIPGSRKVDEETGEILSRPKFATGASIEAVLFAHEAKARDCGDYQYQLDVRSGDGRFANMSRDTFTPAQKFIHKTGIVQLVIPFIGTCSNYYELNQAKKMASLIVPDVVKKSRTPTTSSQMCSTSPHICDEVVAKLLFFEAGCFEYKALGRSAGLIYRTCLAEPLSAKDIAETTGRCLKTVRDALPKLLKYELVTKTGTKYQSDPDVNWAAMGEFLTSDLIVKNRKGIHKKQRILRAEKWKRLHPDEPTTVEPAPAPSVKAPAPSAQPAKVEPVKPRNHYEYDTSQGKQSGIKKPKREKVY